MQKLFNAARSKTAKVVTALVATVASSAAMAQTEGGGLPAWTSTIATDAQSAATDAAALVGPVIGAVIVSLVVIKLIKRFSSKI